MVGFGFRWNVNLVPTADIDFFLGNDGSGNNHIRLRLKATTGDVKLVNAANTEVATITAPFAQNTWYYVEVYCPRTDSATAEVWIDGASATSASSDYNNTGGQGFSWVGSLVTGEDIWIDDMYGIRSIAATSERYGPSAVYAYQPGNTTVTSDLQNDLDTGVWNNAGKTPLETATTAISFTGSPDNGSVYFNDAASGGRGPGPSGGAYTVDGTIRGAKYCAVLYRGTGAGSNHHLLVGNNVDGITTSAKTLTTSPVFSDNVVTSDGTIVPIASEVFAIGLRTSGAQDILCDEMWAMLLHTPADVPQQKNWIRTGNVQNMFGVRPGRIIGRSW
jgi:hypothetical protein